MLNTTGRTVGASRLAFATLLASFSPFCLAQDGAKAEPEAKAAAAEAKEPQPALVPFASIDAMYYKWSNPTQYPSERSWNLNGLRETLIGVRTPERAEGATGMHVLFNLELGVGAERGEHGRQWSLEARQIFTGVQADWGQLTIGNQNNVMTSIAWNVLNPIDNGWGIYWNDLLYMGDTFADGRADAGALADAGANWFNGYMQRGVVYQFKGEGFTVQADYMNAFKKPGLKGSTLGLGGTYQLGKLTLAGAFARQRTEYGLAARRNAVVGGVYTIDDVKLYLSHMTASNSLGAHYNISYGGIGWQANKSLNLSAALARYRQNSGAAFGSGDAHGLAVVADYAINEHVNVYAEADSRRHNKGSDGSYAAYPNGGTETNLMFGMSYTY